MHIFGAGCSLETSPTTVTPNFGHTCLKNCTSFTIYSHIFSNPILLLWHLCPTTAKTMRFYLDSLLPCPLRTHKNTPHHNQIMCRLPSNEQNTSSVRFHLSFSVLLPIHIYPLIISSPLCMALPISFEMQCKKYYPTRYYTSTPNHPLQYAYPSTYHFLCFVSILEPSHNVQKLTPYPIEQSIMPLISRRLYSASILTSLRPPSRHSEVQAALSWRLSSRLSCMQMI